MAGIANNRKSQPYFYAVHGRSLVVMSMFSILIYPTEQ